MTDAEAAAHYYRAVDRMETAEAERDEARAALDRVRALADQIANEQGGFGIEFQESQGEFAARMHAAIAGDGPQRTHDRTFCERCDTWHAWKHQDGQP